MVKAYVLIECETGSIQSIVDDIRGIDAVTDATAVTGEYDIITELEVDQVDQILKTVAGRIHELPGVEDTTTCIST
ncbi:MAG: Lrp/AsnC ligand binding domain-containing protein [Halobacteria archaeon]|nr:Lrp/AsnC ligand binding domain-containing protein [Halobacteria archaeon]